MADIQVTEMAEKKLKELLQDEPQDACVRLRIFTFGSACQARQMFGLSIDSMDDMEDISLGVVQGIPFIAEEEFIDQYGDSFLVDMNKDALTLTSKNE